MVDASACPGTVFVVDDDAAVLASLKFSLELDGYTVEAHATGEALVERAERPMSGCLVLDYGLPGMNGLQLLEALRGRRVDLPAVLMTTQPSRAVQEQAAAAGASIVEKPLLTDALIDRVEEAMAQGAGAGR